MQRRTFLAGGAAIVPGLRPWRGWRLPLPAVVAESTIFHAHPEGQRTLVRFHVEGLDAPAGRLRVYVDGERTLLGTAGVLPMADGTLKGELWLPLERALRIRTELEYPGTRRPLRDRFLLQPTDRLTIHWLPMIGAGEIARRLRGQSSLFAAVHGTTLHRAGVLVDPLEDADPPSDLSAARLIQPAADAARRLGLPLAPIASVRRGFAGIPAVLRGSGVLACLAELDEPWWWLDAAPTSVDTLARLIEQGLVDRERPGAQVFVAFAAGTSPEVLVRLVENWNDRYAWPALAVRATPTALTRRPNEIPPPPANDAPERLAARRTARAQHRASEAADTFGTLSRQLGGNGDPFADLSAAFNYPVGGILACNPTPWGRTDVVTVPGGASRIVTDVPGMGFAFVPGDATARWTDPVAWDPPSDTVIENAGWRIAIDRRTGTITSLARRPHQQELAGPEGLLALTGARLLGLARQSVAGLGTRLVLRRRTRGDDVTTSITLYDGVDVVDLAIGGTQWRSETHLDLPDYPGTSWAEPLGRRDAADAPVATFRHGDWVATWGDAGTVVVATPETDVASRTASGQLVLTVPAGGARWRIGYTPVPRPNLLADELWRLGATATPFVAVPTPGTGRADLPTFGHLVTVADPGARVLGLRAARDGLGAIAWIHDLAGYTRAVPLQAGLLRFTRAFACDLLERDERELTVRDGVVLRDVPAHGVAAIRLVR